MYWRKKVEAIKRVLEEEKPELSRDELKTKIGRRRDKPCKFREPERRYLDLPDNVVLERLSRGGKS